MTQEEPGKTIRQSRYECAKPREDLFTFPRRADPEELGQAGLVLCHFMKCGSSDPLLRAKGSVSICWGDDSIPDTSANLKKIRIFRLTYVESTWMWVGIRGVTQGVTSDQVKCGHLKSQSSCWGMWPGPPCCAPSRNSKATLAPSLQTLTQELLAARGSEAALVPERAPCCPLRPEVV